MTFENVRIPADTVIGEIGKGLKYALTILNIGRAVSIPAICLGMAKQAWQPTLDRANTRYTFQKPLAERQTQQMRIGRMAADLFAMESSRSLSGTSRMNTAMTSAWKPPSPNCSAPNGPSNF